MTPDEAAAELWADAYAVAYSKEMGGPMQQWSPSDRLDRVTLNRGLVLERDASVGPWKVSSEIDGWLLASLGDDDDGSWFVVTDGVHASEMSGEGPKADGEFIAWARNHVGRMLRELERLYAMEMGMLAPNPQPVD